MIQRTRHIPRVRTAALETRATAWAKILFSHPNRTSTGFWAGGAVAIASVLPLAGWSPRAFVALAAIAASCCLITIVRLTADRQLPRWTLHVDVGVATILASVLAAIGATDNVPFADLYVWVAIFAALYFRPPAALAYVAGVGGSYAVVLLAGPPVPEPVVAWLSLFGTSAVAAAAVFGLTSVLRDTAQTDHLTGLANRRKWDERFEEEMARAVRGGSVLSVVMIDLDDFKVVNDAGGHDAGDRLLLDVTTAWRGVVRGGGDVLARLGGDEFCLLAPGSDEAGARALATRLADAMPADISASMGIATWDGTESASALLGRADQALYQEKERRRGDSGVTPTSMAPDAEGDHGTAVPTGGISWLGDEGGHEPDRRGAAQARRGSR